MEAKSQPISKSSDPSGAEPNDPSSTDSHSEKQVNRDVLQAEMKTISF